MGLIRKKNDNQNAKQESKKPMSKGKKRLIGVVLMMCLLFVMVSLNYLVARAALTTNKNHKINVIISSTGEYRNDSGTLVRNVSMKKVRGNWFWVNDKVYDGHQGDSGYLTAGTKPDLGWQQGAIYPDTSFSFSGNVSYNTPFVFIGAQAPPGYKYVGMKAIENYQSGGTKITDLTFFPAYYDGLDGYMVDVGCYFGNWVSYPTEQRMKELFRIYDSTVKIVPQVKPIKYTIKYHANYGTGTMNPSTYEYGTTGKLRVNDNLITRDGYDFVGWKIQGKSTIYPDGYEVSNWTEEDNKTFHLYAQWEKKNFYKVTLEHPNEDTSSVNESTDVFYVWKNTLFLDEKGTKEIEKITVAKSTGRSLKGYFTSGGQKKIYSTGKIDSSVKNITQNTTYTAQWTDNQTTLTIDLDGGGWSIDKKFSFVATGSETSKAINEIPTKSGYKFKEWEFTGDGTWTTSNSKKGTYTIDKSVKNGKAKLTAIWDKENIINVTLDNRGATTTGTKKFYVKKDNNVTKLYKNTGCTTLLNPDESNVYWISVPKKNDCIFKGYYTEKNGGTQCIQSDGRVLVKGYTENTTLYAHWVYTITLDSGGAPTPGTKSFAVKYKTGIYSDYSCSKEISSITKPVWTGRTFLGYWDEDVEEEEEPKQMIYSNGKIDNRVKNYDRNKTFVAHWKKHYSTLTVDTNGGYRLNINGEKIDTNLDSLTKGYNYQWYLNVVKDHNQFLGWDITLIGEAGTLESTTSPETTFTFGAKDGAEGTIVAMWDPNVYTITLNAGSGVTSAGTAAYYEKYDVNNYAESSCQNIITKITIPTRTGYTFGGYQDSNENIWVNKYGKIQSTPTTFTSNTNLTAIWIPNTSTLKLNAKGGKLPNGLEVGYFTGSGVNGDKKTDTIPTKDGDTFVRWEPALDNKGTAGNWNGLTFEYGLSQDGFSSFEAVWAREVSSTLVVDPSGGTWNGYTTAQTYKENNGTVMNIPKPTRDGFTFLKWDDSNVTNGTLAGNTTPWNATKFTFSNSGTDEIVALWNPIVTVTPTATITIDPNGGTWTHSGTPYTSSKSFTQNCNTTMTVESPVWSGHTFIGWDTSEIGNAGSLSGTTFTFGSIDGGSGTLKAKWEPISTPDPDPEVYTITLNAGSGVTSTNHTKAYYEKYGVNNYAESSCQNVITKITIPTRTGYTFAGYGSYVDADGNIKSTSTTFTSDTNLDASWNINSSTITVNPNGGHWEGSSTPKSITQNYDTTRAISDPVRTGYTFDGWTVSGNAGSLSGTTFTFGPNKDGVGALTANWTPNVYTITLDDQDATSTDHTKAYYEKYNVNNYAEPSCTTAITKVTKPSKTGHTFNGYYTETNGSGTQYVDASGNILSGTTTFTSSTTLYASWTIHSSTVTIAPNGGKWTHNGTDYTTSKSFTQNYNTTMTIENPTLDGYIFGSWTKSSTFTAGSLSGTTFTFGEIKNGVGTLTASWSPITFYVAYNGNGATGGSMSNSTHTYDDTSDTFSKNGYERKFTITFDANGGTVSPTSGVASAPFNGWATSSTGAKEYDDQASVPNLTSTNGATVTLYAKWGNATLSSLPTPTRIGYTFDYWYIEETNGTETKVTTSTNFASNTTIYAHWTPNQYKVTLDDQGATSTDHTKEVTATYDATLPSIKIPSRKYTVTFNANGGSVSPASKVAEYSFNGYYTKTSGGTQYYTSSGAGSVYNIASDTTFYAQWTSASVTLPTPTRTGYIFDYWYVGSTNVGGGGASYTPTSDVTLIAHWTPITYTIKYYNGSTELGSSIHTYDSPKNLTTWSTLGGVVKNSSYGWEFVGWATSSSSYTVTYTDGQSVSNLTTVNNDVIKIYAVYKRTITFKHGDGGSKTNTETQQWNPSGNTNGTHVGPVSSPELEDVTNWTDGGFRNDESATSAGFGENTTIYPPVDQSPTFYGSYYRDVTFKSGVNATVTDKIERQYLTSNGNKVSDITSGNPSDVTNWTPLGYRDDTTSSTSEYASNSTIAPAYTTPNTFYATYSRTLTVGYSANNVPPLVASGSVADTTKTVYMNSASTSTSDQSITLRKNGFTYIGYKFVKWDVGYPDSTYNPGLPYNHGTFKVVAYAVWEHDGSGVGTLFTPILKVSNPSDSGIYYNDGVYFVKGDGNTAIELYGEAKLDPALITRVDKLSLNDGENVLTSNPKYTETYNVEVPKYDVLNAIYKKENVTNYNTHTGLFKKLGEPSIVDITQSKFSFKQKFTITGRVLKEQYIGARASCMDRNCTDASHTLVAYGNSVRFHGDPYKPYAYIVDESGKQVSTNEYDTKWTNQEKVTVVFKDDDSGIKEYKFTEDGVVLEEKKNTEYVTNESIVLDLKEGVKEYVLKVEDNVGNLIVITFTPHVDRTAPSLTDLIDYKVMASGNVSQGRSDVYTGNGNTDAWPTTSKDATWEYDWQKLKELSYKATDDRAGLRNVKITHYKQDSSYTTAWKGETLVNVVGDVLNASKEQLITSFNGDTYYEEGKSYLLIEMEDLPGNRTVVKLVVRRDKNGVKISNSKVTPTKLENFKSSELESLFASGDMSKFKTNVRFSIDDKVVTGDTGGIKKLEVIVLDPSTNAELKRYDVTSNLAVSSYTDETNKGDARFAPLVRALTGSINVNIDTMGEFPGYTHLKFAYEVEDHVGNKTLVEDRSVVEGGEGPGVVPNFSMKTTVYATKDNAYNIATSDGLSSMAYFKTGEVGYVEVWSVGYVERIELDFSEGGVGQKMNEAIGLGLMEPKYILGVHNGLPNQVRFVDLKGFKLDTPYGDHNGVPYASHIGYEFSEVNNSTGAYGVDGWKAKGSMVRIPTTYELVKRNELDKYGNELYEWEVHEARVYPTKLGKVLHPSASHYTIWDEAGDDLHFRVTHQTFGY